MSTESSSSFESGTTNEINQDVYSSFLKEHPLVAYSLAFTLVWFLLIRLRTPLQYYVKFATYFVIVMTYSFFLIPFALLRPKDCRNIIYVGKTLSFLLRILDVDVVLENGKYLQVNQPYVLIANHQSALDFLTMMKIWPGGNCTPLAKKELFWAGPFGLAIWLCGITFIDRLNHEKAKGTIIKLSERINRENLRTFVFPEGTRNFKTQMLPFKKGAFHLAVEAQVPIICVVVSSYLNFFSNQERKFLNGGLVKVRVLPPFQTKGMTADSVGQLTKHLQEKMQHEFDLLNSEINLDEKYLTKTTSGDASSCSTLNDSSLNTTCASDELHQVLNSSLDEEAASFNDKEKDFSMENKILNDDNNNSINDDEKNKKIS